MIQRSAVDCCELSGVHVPVEKKIVVCPAPLGMIWQPSPVPSIPRSASDTQRSPRCIHQTSPSVANHPDSKRIRSVPSANPPVQESS